MMNKSKQAGSKEVRSKSKSNAASAINEQNKSMVSKPFARIRLPDGSQQLVLDDEDKSSDKRNPKLQKNIEVARKADKKSAQNKQPEIKLNTQPRAATLDQFSNEAQRLKSQIVEALDKQVKRQESESEGSKTTAELAQLRANISLLAEEVGEECCSEKNSVAKEASPKDVQEERQKMDGNVQEGITNGENMNQLSLTQSDQPAEEKVDGQTVPKDPEQEIPEAKQSTANGFEPLLLSNLDPESKFVALKSSLSNSSETFETLCRKLVELSETNQRLLADKLAYQNEREKLILVKEKLEQLCRELQKSNNSVRIESLQLIKAEQTKAKEQAAKIQSTLSGVMKLFDENQQRNLSLKQENLDLQNKLKALLEHCDNWEKGVETILKQRDIENRLIRTELAKANLLNNEEKGRFLEEKKELLKVMSLMKEQQNKIEGQEAKLRSDLTNYASKYNECQSAISSGLGKFQSESRKMLKQLEKSRHDYVALLSKYEQSNKRIGQLLEEKKSWEKESKISSKKIATLERLCRALKAGGEPNGCCNHLPTLNEWEVQTPEVESSSPD